MPFSILDLRGGGGRGGGGLNFPSIISKIVAFLSRQLESQLYSLL